MWRSAESAVHPGTRRMNEWLIIVGLLSILKLAIVAVDPNLRVFLGDSASYLHAALTTWNPPDRSITYPWLVALATREQSGLLLVGLQTGLGVASCLLAYWILRRGGAVPRLWATTTVLLIALEPAQLFYERMLMAESAGFLALMAMLAAGTGFVGQGRLRWLVLAVLSGLAAVSLRMSLLPVVLGLTALLPLMRYLVDAGEARKRRMRLALHVIVMLVVSVVMHTGYKVYYGRVMDCAPSYMRNEGQMRLGLVVPLIRPEHLSRVGVSPELLNRVSIPLNDPRTREAHMWMSGGLWQVLQNELGDEQALRVARKVAARALRSDPLGLIRMGLATTLDYFDSSIAQPRMQDDLGSRAPDEKTLVDLGESLHVYRVPRSDEGVGRWFAGARWWLTGAFLLGTPLALLLLWRARVTTAGREAKVVLAFCLLGLCASQVLFSHIVSFRYLHAMPALLLLGFALAMFASRQASVCVDAAAGQNAAD